MLNPVFIAHRGYAAHFPENTLIAIDAAREAGAHYIEVDIQLTADKVPVLFHDRDLQRLCRQSGAIHDYTFEQLKQFDVTHAEKFADKYVGNKLTSLQMLVDYLQKHPQLNAFIELKRIMIDTFSEQCVLDTVLSLFLQLKNQVTFISYNQSILKNIHSNTEYATGIVVDDWKDYNKNDSWTPEWLFCAVEGLPEDNEELKIKPTIVVFEVGNMGIAKHVLEKGITHLETFRIKEMLRDFAKVNKN